MAGDMDHLPIRPEQADLVYDASNTGVRAWIWDVLVLAHYFIERVLELDIVCLGKQRRKPLGSCLAQPEIDR